LAEKLGFLSKYYTHNEIQFSEIFVNFFIRLIFNSCLQKEEKDILHKSLYMLRKTFFIWPNIVYKFDQIKQIITKFQIKDQLFNSLDSQEKLKYQYALLSLLNILVEFQTGDFLIKYMKIIYELLFQTSFIAGQQGGFPPGSSQSHGQG